MPLNYEHQVVLPASEGTPATRERGSLFYIGTATLLIRCAGFTVLTDPNFLHLGEQVHLGFRQKSSRITNPAIGFGALPVLDLVLLSHLHEDHFDREVTRKLAKNLPIVTTPQGVKALAKKRFQVLHGLKTWQYITLIKGDMQLKITAMPGRHGPGLLSALFPPVMGSMLEFQTRDQKSVYRIYISGDTVAQKQMRQIAKRFPQIDLAILHMGGEKLYGMQTTLNGKQAVDALKSINARETIPVHYNDYSNYSSPLEDFRAALAKTRLEKRIRYLGRGDLHTFQFPAARS